MKRRRMMMLAAAWLCAVAPAAAQAGNDGGDIFRHGWHGGPACASCHGARGQGGVGPRLAGLGEAYVLRQLEAFAQGTRNNALMQPVARRLDGPAMRAVAAWIATLEPNAGGRGPKAAGERPPRLVTQGDWSRGIPACVDCHGPNLMGDRHGIPAIAGQPARYLEKRLRAMRAARQPDALPARVMARVSRALSDADIRDLARAISRLDGRTLPGALTAESGMPSGRPGGHALTLPAEPRLASAIERGARIFMDTPRFASRWVGRGNRLSCVNCHLDRGRLASAAPMWAAAVRYPRYRKKNNRVNTLAMRIQGCFRYSLNGAPPPADSPVMVALLSYIRWLATGMPLGAKPPAHGFPKLAKPEGAPDPVRGARLYQARCALCHGEDGAGRMAGGRTLFPPLWGAHSFNWGAGMHRVDKAAAFIHANMPFGAGGSLSGRDAWDIAAFVDAHDRPDDPRLVGLRGKARVEAIRRLHGRANVDFYAACHAGSGPCPIPRRLARPETGQERNAR